MSPRAWRTLGWVVATVVATVGLVTVAFAVFVVVSFNSWGSNK